MGSLHFGTHPELEQAANDLIRASLKEEGDTPAAKSDILTPWKETARRSREVFTSDGVPDPAVRKGIFKRAYNRGCPHLNSRDGHFPGMRIINDHAGMDPSGYTGDRDSASRLGFDEVE